MAPTSKKARPRLAWLRQVLLLVVSSLILYYYLHEIDWRDFLAATRGADLIIASVAFVVPQLIIWFAECLVIQRAMTWFHGPLDLKKLFWVRGALYLLHMVNAGLARGGTLLYLRRKTGIGWPRLFGIIFFLLFLIMSGAALMLILPVLADMIFEPRPGLRVFTWVWFLVLVAGGYLLFESWLTWRRGRRIGFHSLFVRNPESEFWSSFRESSGRHWLATFAIALPSFLAGFIGYFFMARAFHVQVPFWEFMATLPIVVTLANLPVAFSGFGTTTFAWMLFYREYGTAEDMAALTVFIPCARTGLRSVIGLVSLVPSLRELRELGLLSGAAELGPEQKSAASAREKEEP